MEPPTYFTHSAAVLLARIHVTLSGTHRWGAGCGPSARPPGESVGEPDAGGEGTVLSHTPGRKSWEHPGQANRALIKLLNFK